MKAVNPDHKTLLRRRGLRVTLQRELILDALAEDNGHHTPAGNFFTAWTLKDRIAKWLNPAPLPYRS